MFYCKIDHALPRVDCDVNSLFAQYTAQNVHPDMTAAYAAPIATGAFNHVPPSPKCRLAENEGMVLLDSEWTAPNTLCSCSMIMAYEPGGQDTYVYHAGGGVLPLEQHEFQRRATTHSIVMATPCFCIEGESLESTSYYHATQNLLVMGYPADRICLIDGIILNNLIYMKGDGTIAGC